jgi:hypothetical protein
MMFQCGSGSWWTIIGVRPCQFLSTSWQKLEHLSSNLNQNCTPFVCSHETISVATTRPLNILHMGLINDVLVWFWLLLSHWCQAVSIF